MEECQDPATASPSSMATMRLNATVATAVSTRTNASRCVERSTAHAFDGSTIRTAVTIYTAASAASGILGHQRTGGQDDDQKGDRVDHGPTGGPGLPIWR